MSEVFAVSGGKNSGKTTLIEGLVAYFSSRGIKTAVIKHDGHGFEPDRDGADSRRFYDAGACGTAVFDGEKIQVVRRSREEIMPQRLFPEADIILLEGFKYSGYPKIWMSSEEKFDNVENIMLRVGDGAKTVSEKDVKEAAECILEYIRRRKNE